MKFILIFVILRILNCDANICCPPEQGVLEDGENYCVNLKTNVTTPTNVTCMEAVPFTSSAYNFSMRDGILKLELTEDMVVDVVSGFCFANGTRNSSEAVVMLCADIEEELVEESIYGYCMIVSVIFLALTIFVYSSIPKLRDVLGKSIVSFCLSLSIGLSVLAIMKIMEYSNLQLCAARGFCTYFFLLASFFWSNAISIQILRSLGRPMTSDYTWRPFLGYALYSWGCPALLTFILAIVNYTPGKHRKPGIGLNTCWFFDSTQQWYYMYSVMSILIAVNICIFVYISFSLWRHSFASTHIKALKYKLGMTVRMFIVMGLPWIFEMISSFNEPHIIWVILDFFNVLQGLLLFLILVVFRRRVIKELYNKGWLQCFAPCAERHLAVGEDEEDVIEHTIGYFNDSSSDGSLDEEILEDYEIDDNDWNENDEYLYARKLTRRLRRHILDESDMSHSRQLEEGDTSHSRQLEEGHATDVDPDVGPGIPKYLESCVDTTAGEL